jgi:hypothetical protein
MLSGNRSVGKRAQIRVAAIAAPTTVLMVQPGPMPVVVLRPRDAETWRVAHSSRAFHAANRDRVAMGDKLRKERGQ